jgi:hypothetical protein
MALSFASSRNPAEAFIRRSRRATPGGCPSGLSSSRAGRFSIRSEDLPEKRRSGD